MRLPVALLALLLVALPLTGCFSKDTTPPTYTVKATGGKVSPGWAYDGAGLEGGDATLSGVLSNPDNKGAVFANFTYQGAKYEALFNRFAQAEGKTFQDGGVAFGLTEHGDSKVGDAALPMIHAKAVAYGVATLVKDGKPLTGKTGLADWTAHLMVFDDAVRGPDGKITNAAGSGPYDPAKPTDAKTYPGKAQAMLKLVGPDGETATRAPVHVDKNVTIQGPQANAPVDVPVEPGALPFTINVNSTSANPQAPVPLMVGTITVTITAGNKTLATDTANIQPNQGYAKSFPVKAEDIAGLTGPIKVDISGSGAYGVEVTANVAYDDHPFLVVTWDNPTLT